MNGGGDVVVGCDVVEVGRIADALARPGFADRVFTPREQADAVRGGVEAGSELHRARLAARFAAKEAARKAVGDLRIGFHATEVRTGPGGAPRLWIDGAPSELALSLSHDGGIAMAVVTGPGSHRGAPRPDPPAQEPERKDENAAG